MTRLKDLDRIVSDVIKQLQDISDNMGRYKKIDTDLRARALMKEIREKIKQINSCMEVFTRPDLRAAYENYNFDEFVTNIKSYVTESQATYERIKKFEDITEYY